jgi:hypothetical protein
MLIWSRAFEANRRMGQDIYYQKWRADCLYALAPAGALIAQYMQTHDGVPATSESGKLESGRNH